MVGIPMVYGNCINVEIEIMIMMQLRIDKSIIMETRKNISVSEHGRHSKLKQQAGLPWTVVDILSERMVVVE